MRATRVSISREQDSSSPKTLTPQRKHCKLLNDGSSEVWPDNVERIFVQGSSYHFHPQPSNPPHSPPLYQVFESIGNPLGQPTLAVEVIGGTNSWSRTCSVLA
ncbi:hypothetical protein AZE42_06689 [Rhizopogon vesiculosus]|uniref:Uncharacterized protein n=1 Tax=Rhizopogon vesiculosus TaxID=180088 RepID=A0A1J8PGC3_9AGAM|nr:hypothetical protein AZE42_06689 [Rhizopogon vesiculosus]